MAIIRAPSSPSRRRTHQKRIAAAQAVIGAAYSILDHIQNYGEREAQHTSILTGEMWMRELLTGHPSRIKNNLGISKDDFRALVHELIRRTDLRPTRYVSLAESVGMLLYLLRWNAPFVQISERFQRSTETVFR
jgi:hypothetical protein